MQSVATQVAEQMLHYAMIEKNVVVLGDALLKVELVSQYRSRNCGCNKTVECLWQGMLLSLESNLVCMHHNFRTCEERCQAQFSKE